MTDGGEGCKPLNSPNFINAMKEYHSKKPKEEYATYGMLGKKFPDEAKEKVGKANSYPVVCEGKEFPSIKSAEEYYKSLGDKTFNQLSFEEMQWQSNETSNSVSVIAKHIIDMQFIKHHRPII